MILEPISFCINTAVNELDNLKLLFKSLKDNLRYNKHEIIVFIDSDNEGTYEWLLTQKNKFHDLKILKNPLPICYGYARNINEMFKFATYDVVSYLQSDMVISKDYDFYISKHVKPNVVLSSTRIEPPLHGPGPEKHTVDFGLYPEQFKYNEFQEYCKENRMDKITNYFFAPFTMYKSVWNDIGGHDTQFRRSREDSDVVNRLVLAGNKIIQSWDALVYHFTCTSSRGKDWFNQKNTKAQERVKMQQQADTLEMKKYIKKWGVPIRHGDPTNYFYKVDAYLTIDVNTPEKLEIIEPYFNTVYLKGDVNLHANRDFDTLPNKLLNIDQKDWDKYSYLYNKTSLYKFDKSLPDSDILVTFNLSAINLDNYHNFIENLQHIIHETEDLGEFEYGPFKIKINKKINTIKDKIVVTNPSIKSDDLYLIS